MNHETRNNPKTNLAQKQNELYDSVDLIDGLEGHRFLQRKMDTIHAKTGVTTSG